MADLIIICLTIIICTNIFGNTIIEVSKNGMFYEEIEKGEDKDDNK